MEEEKKELEIMAEKARIEEQKAALEAKLAAAKAKEAEARMQRELAEKKRKRAEAKEREEIDAARALLIGTQLPKLETREGKSYELVEIQKVTPANLKIVHQDGYATVSFGQLTAAWQKKVRYDSIEANDYLNDLSKTQKENKQAAADKKADATAKRKETATARKNAAALEIPAEEKKLHDNIAKFINLKKKTEISYTALLARRDRLTRGSANWNTVDKQLDQLNTKILQHDDQITRYQDLLSVKENARYKSERIRRDEERRRERAARKR